MSEGKQEARRPRISDMGVGDVAYGIAVQAVEGKWDALKLGPYMARFAIDYADERVADAACQANQPQEKAQPESGEIGQEVDRWPLCCQESYDFGFQMGKVAGSREMAEKAAQVCDNYGSDKTDLNDYDCETAAALAEKIRSLAGAVEPPQGEAEKEGRT